MQMNQVHERMSWLVTARPWVTIIVLLIVTVVLAAGANLRAPPTEGASVAFLPPGHDIAEATREIDQFFGDSGEVSIVTIIFRGGGVDAKRSDADGRSPRRDRRGAWRKRGCWLRSARWSRRRP